MGSLDCHIWTYGPEQVDPASANTLHTESQVKKLDHRLAARTLRKISANSQIINWWMSRRRKANRRFRSTISVRNAGKVGLRNQPRNALAHPSIHGNPGLKIYSRVSSLPRKSSTLVRWLERFRTQSQAT